MPDNGQLPGSGLVLSRKEGESVVIAGEIFVTVAEIKGDKVRLHFAAPRDIPINRLEVQKKIDEGTNGPV